MPAIPPSGRYMGAKQISRTRNGKVAYAITLFDKETGELAFLVDGIAITAMRTAATSAMALQALSSAPCIGKLAIIGAGLEAHSHLRAIASVKRIEKLAVYSPTPENRARFAADATATLDIVAEACTSPEEAVSGATHVIAAARSRDESPILYSAWLDDGTVVVSIGSTTASQREVDVSVIARAGLIVSDETKELGADTGDMIAANSVGISFSDKLFSLYDLVQSKIPAALLESSVVMFKSVGSALQDISFAEHVANAATASGLGATLGVDLKIKQSIGKNS
jgi:ornithine cyclodeaminase/alanine dehydrogenase